MPIAMPRKATGKRGLKVQMRRFNLISDCIYKGMTFEHIMEHVNTTMSAQFSKSTLEKDLQILRKELNAPIVVKGRPSIYKFSKPWSFTAQIVKWCVGSDEYQLMLHDDHRHQLQVKSAQRELNDEHMRMLSSQLEDMKKEQELLRCQLNSISCLSPHFDPKVRRFTQLTTAVLTIEQKLKNMRQQKPILGYA